MEQIVITPDEIARGGGACTHPVLDIVEGGWRCMLCGVLITNSYRGADQAAQVPTVISNVTAAPPPNTTAGGSGTTTTFTFRAA